MQQALGTASQKERGKLGGQREASGCHEVATAASAHPTKSSELRQPFQVTLNPEPWKGPVLCITPPALTSQWMGTATGKCPSLGGRGSLQASAILGVGLS